MQPGLDVLNCAAGHLMFRFDKTKTEEVEKAKKVIKDMLSRGYMLFAIVDGQHTRIRKFDAEREEYILEEPETIPEPEPSLGTNPRAPRARKTNLRERRIRLHETRATGIGPTAGG